MTNELLPELGVHAHLLFACLWMVADRDGRLEDRPKKIKADAASERTKSKLPLRHGEHGAMHRGKPIVWPTADHDWWWIRYKIRPRGKWRVMLVRIIKHGEEEFVEPFGDNNAFSQAIIEGMQSTFLPAEPPPSDGEWAT